MLTLAGVQIPVQVWRGDRDEAVPYETNTQVVERELAGLAEPQHVPGAGFDRATAHEAMNASVLAFFEKAMPKAGS